MEPFGQRTWYREPIYGGNSAKKKKGRGDRSGVGATGFKHLGKLLYLVSPNSENGATQ